MKVLKADSLSDKDMFFSEKADRESMYKQVLSWYTTMETTYNMKFSTATEADYADGKPVTPPVPGPAVYCPKEPTPGYCSGAWGKCTCDVDPITKEKTLKCTGNYAKKCETEFGCSCEKPPSTTTTTANPSVKHPDWAHCSVAQPLCENPKSMCTDTGPQTACSASSNYCQCQPKQSILLI